MASRNGYKLLKTNEDDSDFSTSKPGPSSETQAGDQNDDIGRVVSGPGILESTKVESLRFDERSTRKWTHSCSLISNSEEPMTKSSGEESGQCRDSIGAYREQPVGGEGRDIQHQQPDGGEGGDNQHQQPHVGEGVDNQEQPGGGEGRDIQHQQPGGGEGRDIQHQQPHVGEGGDNQQPHVGEGGGNQEQQPHVGEGGDNQHQQPHVGEGGDNQHQQPHVGEGGDNQEQPDGDEGSDNQELLDGGERDQNLDCFQPCTRWCNSCFSRARSITKLKIFIWVYLVCSFFLAVANTVLGILSIDRCTLHDKPSYTFLGITIAASVVAFILVIHLACVICRRSFSCLSCYYNRSARRAFLMLAVISFVIANIEFVIYSKINCGERFDVYAKIILGLTTVLTVFGFIIYSPDHYDTLYEPRRMIGQNGECHMPAEGPEAQV